MFRESDSRHNRAGDATVDGQFEESDLLQRDTRLLVNYRALNAFGVLRTGLAWRRPGVVVPDRLLCRCGRSAEAM